jgi:hypothetical protein
VEKHGFTVWNQYVFTSCSKMFHSYSDVTIACERLQNLLLCSALTNFEQGGIFIVPHLLWHGALVFFFRPFFFFFFFISNFFDLSITEDTWVVKMCISCIKIVNVLVLHPAWPLERGRERSYFRGPQNLMNGTYCSCTDLVIITSEMIFKSFFCKFVFKPFLRKKIDPMPLK